MTHRRRLLLVAGVALTLTIVVAWYVLSDLGETITDAQPVGRPPAIAPDYAGVVLPPNIAPINFVVEEPGTKYRVRIRADVGETIEVFTRSSAIVIPPGRWRALLDANRGGTLTLEVCVKDDAGAWHRFDDVVNTIAEEPIDPYLVYREMPPFNLIWMNMSLRQRALSTDDETVLLHNRSYAHGCMNCHTFLKQRPERLALNVRTASPSASIRGGMLLVRDGTVTRVVDTKTPMNRIPATFLAWHPDGEVVAFSTNKINQTFHTCGETRHSVDSFSDVGLYLVGSNTVTTSPKIARADRLETHPAWSADGRTLYFCSARPNRSAAEREKERKKREAEIEAGTREGPVWSGRHEPYFRIDRYRDLRYELMCIDYNPKTNTFGKKVVTVLTTEATRAGLCRIEIPKGKRDIQRSIAQPRVSPDGRFILLCVCAFGNFPVYQKTSDLYLLDLETKVCRPLSTLNSEQSESWHAWSSNGRWVVFSSKRPGGLLARPYFSYIDATGAGHKPFVLPQKDPAFYASHFRAFNRPELVAEPIALTSRQLLRALHDPEKQTKATLAPDLQRTDADTAASPSVH